MRVKELHNRPWEVLGSEIAFSNPWYKIRRDTVRLPNGLVIENYFVSELLDVSLVFPVTKEGDVVFVRQYRHGPQEVLLELPGGTYRRGTQRPARVARRELEEETGYRANALIFLGKLYDYPTKDSHQLRLYLAPDVEPVGIRNPNPTEDIEIVLIPASETLKLIEESKVRVTGTIAGITMAMNYLNNRNSAENT